MGRIGSVRSHNQQLHQTKKEVLPFERLLEEIPQPSPSTGAFALALALAFPFFTPLLLRASSASSSLETFIALSISYVVTYDTYDVYYPITTVEYIIIPTLLRLEQKLKRNQFRK